MSAISFTIERETLLKKQRAQRREKALELNMPKFSNKTFKSGKEYNRQKNKKINWE